MYQIASYPLFSYNGDFNMITMASGAVIVQNEKVLVVREAEDHKFSFPGGTVQAYESLEQTTEREVREELSIDIKVKEHPFVYEFRRINNRNEKELVVLFHFDVASAYGRLELGDDAREYTWKGIRDDFEDCFPNVRHAAEYFIKQYDGLEPNYKLEV